MPDNDERELATQANAADPLARQVDGLTPEQQEWLRLAGFSRIERQRLIYARWRYRQGILTDSPSESEE